MTGALHLLMNDYIRDRSPQERDRMMQVHLAEARGTKRNADLLMQSTEAILRLRGSTRHIDGGMVADDPLTHVLSLTLQAIENAGVAYAIAGSFAAGMFGEPIADLTINIILRATPQQAVAVGQSLAPRFYTPEDRLAVAARRGDMMNVIDVATSLKLDLSFVRDDAFLQTVLLRSGEREFGSSGRSFRFVTPEDIILMKLEWRKDTKSQKQWDNVLSVMRVQRNRLDWKYMYDQAEALGVTEVLIRMRDEAGI